MSEAYLSKCLPICYVSHSPFSYFRLEFVYKYKHIDCPWCRPVKHSLYMFYLKKKKLVILASILIEDT